MSPDAKPQTRLRFRARRAQCSSSSVLQAPKLVNYGFESLALSSHVSRARALSLDLPRASAIDGPAGRTASRDPSAGDAPARLLRALADHALMDAQPTRLDG